MTAYVENEEVLTAQLYLDEAYTQAVYSSGEYAQFGLPDTSWANDRIAGSPSADGSLIALAAAQTATGEGTLGIINLEI